MSVSPHCPPALVILTASEWHLPPPGEFPEWQAPITAPAPDWIMNCKILHQSISPNFIIVCVTPSTIGLSLIVLWFTQRHLISHSLNSDVKGWTESQRCVFPVRKYSLPYSPLSWTVMGHILGSVLGVQTHAAPNNQNHLKGDHVIQCPSLPLSRTATMA